VGRVLVGIGATTLILGLAFLMLDRLGVGRVPGDIVVRRPGFTMFVPLGTMILVSILLTLLLNLFIRSRR
jgi:hypothetical protein